MIQYNETNQFALKSPVVFSVGDRVIVNLGRSGQLSNISFNIGIIYSIKSDGNGNNTRLTVKLDTGIFTEDFVDESLSGIIAFRSDSPVLDNVPTINYWDLERYIDFSRWVAFRLKQQFYYDRLPTPNQVIGTKFASTRDEMQVNRNLLEEFDDLQIQTLQRLLLGENFMFQIDRWEKIDHICRYKTEQVQTAIGLMQFNVETARRACMNKFSDNLKFVETMEKHFDLDETQKVFLSAVVDPRAPLIQRKIAMENLDATLNYVLLNGKKHVTDKEFYRAMSLFKPSLDEQRDAVVESASVSDSFDGNVGEPVIVNFGTATKPKYYIGTISSVNLIEGTVEVKSPFNEYSILQIRNSANGLIGFVAKHYVKIDHKQELNLTKINAILDMNRWHSDTLKDSSRPGSTLSKFSAPKQVRVR
jgi:hypothetical protein